MSYKKSIHHILFIIITLLFSLNALSKNLPIVLVHGIMADSHSMKPTKEYIRKYLPCTYVKSIKLGRGKFTSLYSMHDQAHWLKEEMEKDKLLQEGCIMIGHSQGGLVARYFIEKYNQPRVYVYIAWGTPQSGIFGSPCSIDERFWWLKTIEPYTYKFTYSSFMQKWISFASYWKDPLHYDEYLQKCRFLPYLNNEINHDDAHTFKENICSLINMVLVQTTQENVVDPAISCHFGFYAQGSTDTMQSLFDSEWYHADTLGLKTLAESGRLHLKFAHCLHAKFQEDEDNFVNNTLPFLTYEIN